MHNKIGYKEKSPNFSIPIAKAKLSHYTTIIVIVRRPVQQKSLAINDIPKPWHKITYIIGKSNISNKS